MLGGAPKAEKIDKGKHVDKMEKAELMVYARDVLGVETRRVGVEGEKICGEQWRRSRKIARWRRPGFVSLRRKRRPCSAGLKRRMKDPLRFTKAVLALVESFKLSRTGEGEFLPTRG